MTGGVPYVSVDAGSIARRGEVLVRFSEAAIVHLEVFENSSEINREPGDL
jgi:hypothetical protein